MKERIDEKDILRFENEYKSNDKYLAMRNAVSKHGINDIVYNIDEAAKMSFKFSLEIPTMPATNQKASGRCWIFAGLNLLREKVGKKYNLENFEISQNYIAFWDKFEKINYMLESIIETADREADDRTVSWILSTGIQDGGQWDMFVNILKKYGAVPKDAMPESFHSSNTGSMNQWLNHKLREDAAVLRRTIAEKGIEEAYKVKENMLSEMYRILCICFGVPPKSFDFEYVDKNKKYYAYRNITPKQFLDEFVGDTLDEYVSIINAPTKDKPFEKTYTVKFLGNVKEGRKILYLNLSINEMKKLIIKQLKDGEIVWFGSDVGKYGDREKGIWDDKSYSIGEGLGISFGITKEEQLDYRDSKMTHAMVITGVNLIEDGSADRWKIENSWGDDRGNKGYYIISDTWFDRYVYQAVINKKYLTDEQQKMLKIEPIALNPWDPMGSLANL